MEDLSNLFSNLQIDNENECFDYDFSTQNLIKTIKASNKDNDDESFDEFHDTNRNSYECLLQNLIKIIKSSDKTYNINILDNLIILDDILFGINIAAELDDNVVLYKPILRLPAYNKQNIPQKGDPSWWDDCCTEFENSMIHLRNSSYYFINNDNGDLYNPPNIENEIIKLIISILNSAKIIEINLVQMYIISIYLENFFIYNNIGSIYDDEQFLYTNKYFTKFRKLTLEFLESNDLYFSYNINHYKKYINHSLLNVLYGARNTLILFGPYGYDALYENLEFIDLNIREIIGFKKEALKYFALNNLIELKLHNKKYHINNLNEYVSVVCKGARLFE